MMDENVVTVCAVFLIVFAVTVFYIAHLLKQRDQMLDMITDAMDQSYERGFTNGVERGMRLVASETVESELYPFRIAQESHRQIET